MIQGPRAVTAIGCVIGVVMGDLQKEQFRAGRIKLQDLRGKRQRVWGSRRALRRREVMMSRGSWIKGRQARCMESRKKRPLRVCRQPKGRHRSPRAVEGRDPLGLKGPEITQEGNLGSPGRSQDPSTSTSKAKTRVAGGTVGGGEGAEGEGAGAGDIERDPGEWRKSGEGRGFLGAFLGSPRPPRLC